MAAANIVFMSINPLRWKPPAHAVRGCQTELPIDLLLLFSPPHETFTTGANMAATRGFPLAVVEIAPGSPHPDERN